MMRIKKQQALTGLLLIGCLALVQSAGPAAGRPVAAGVDATSFFLDRDRFPLPVKTGSGPLVSPRDIQVGDTEVFWAYGFGFFAGYYHLSATCQKISDHAYFFTEDPRINRVVVHPADANVVIAVADDGPYKSIDGGVTWANLVTADLPAEEITGSAGRTLQKRASVNDAVFPSQTDTETFFIATDFGLFKTTNGGAFWRQAATAMPLDVDGLPPRFNDLLVDPTDRNLMYAATDAGMFVTDRAQTSPVWINISPGLPRAKGGDWDYIIAYQINWADGALIVATESGLYRGALKPVGSTYQVDWRPLDDNLIGNIHNPHVAVTLAEPGEAVSTADSRFLAIVGVDHSTWVRVDQGGGPERRWIVRPQKGGGADEAAYLVELNDDALVSGSSLAGGYDQLSLDELSARTSEALP
ncbi:WD40/YVTN/BNR-like repeat-containing protein, partial [candidate division KSB1 bacterium]